MLGELVGSLTGSTARRHLQEANRESRDFLRQGQEGSEQALNRGYGEAQGYLNPYAQQGQRANALYGRAVGLDGADAQRQFFNEYAGSNPFRQYNEDQANRGLARRFASMGFSPGGGTASLGLARASLDRGAQDYENYINRLAAASGQGAQIAGQQSGLAMGYGQGLAGIRGGFAQQNAANAINYGNAQAQNANVFGQNMIGLAGTAIRAYTGGLTGGLGGGPGGAAGAAGRAANTYTVGGRTMAHV
jgi:hypothetical protein